MRHCKTKSKLDSSSSHCAPPTGNSSRTKQANRALATPDIGANPSAEEADEGTDENTKQVIDVVASFRLNETSFDKKSYLQHLKDYMKKVKSALKDKGASDDEVKEFETKASAYAKKIVANFKDYEFFIGESMDPEGM